MATSASSTRSVRTAARRCSSVATRSAGLRCVYHGWKFDVNGACIDLPNTPEGDTFKNKIKIIAYPCQEAGGMVFAYMGPKEKQPPFPDFDLARRARGKHLRDEVPVGVQLAAGDRGRLRPQPWRLPAQHARQQSGQPGLQRFRDRA